MYVYVCEREAEREAERQHMVFLQSHFFFVGMLGPFTFHIIAYVVRLNLPASYFLFLSFFPLILFFKNPFV